MKINNSSKSFFILFFLIFFIKNNVASELAMGMFEKIKNKTSLLAAPSMQLSFMKYNNLLTLYLGQQLFNTSKVQDLIKIQDLVDNDEIVENKRKMRSYLCLFRINNNFENYFTQNLKEKKYINFSTNILWYFFSTYAFLLKSDKFKKIINFKKYLSLVDQKIKKFVPYFNLIYPFATLIENQYFERKREQERRERQEEERQEREREGMEESD